MAGKAILFAEDAHRALIHGVTVFISGVDVTDYLNSAVSVQLSGRKGQNTASFSLSNVNEAFILTQDNIEGKWRLGGHFTEEVKYQLYRHKTDDSVNPPDTNTGDRRWSLEADSLVLHAYDTVFIAVRYPYSDSEELWIPLFKGYIETKNVSEDRIKGKSSISLSCVDVRRLMSRQRLQTNYLITTESFVVTENQAGTVDEQVRRLNAYDPTLIDGLFADMQLPTNYNTPLAELSLEETLKLLITGTTVGESITDGDEGITQSGYLGRLFDAVASMPEDTETIADIEVRAKERNIEIRGVGRFRQTLGAVRWPPPLANETMEREVLEAWHSLCLFGITNAGKPWTRAQMLAHGAACTWNGATAPHAMQLYMLLPSAQGGMKGVTEYAYDSGSSSRSWVSRLTAIEDMLEKLDYQWGVTGSGDIIVEFPMYDFDPEMFGRWSSVFTLESDQEIKSMSYEDDRPVPAVLSASGSWAANPTLFAPALVSGDGASLTNTRVTLYAPLVAARYGMEVERVSFPFVTDVCRLRQFAVLHFQRRLAEGSGAQYDFVYRPLLLPNRPFYGAHRRRKGWIAGFSITVAAIKEHGIPTTSATLKYIRKPDNNGKYRLITGAQNLALSYNGSGPSITPDRGIMVTESFSLGQVVICEGDTVGIPAGLAEGSIYIPAGGSSALDDIVRKAKDPESGCSTDESKLSAAALSKWRELKAAAESKYKIGLSLTCTHNASAKPHENLPNYGHDQNPSPAFDIEIHKLDGSAGRYEDYLAVGALGKSLGLRWGGDLANDSTSSIVTIQRKIVERANFHISRATPYLWGGDFSSKKPGVDCSGLAIDCYRYAGITKMSDASAATLMATYPKPKGPAKAGCLAFYNGGTHVAVLIEDQDAGGHIANASGGRKHTTLAKAAADGACVKRKHYQYWSAFDRFGSPFEHLATAGSGYLNHFSL